MKTKNMLLTAIVMAAGIIPSLAAVNRTFTEFQYAMVSNPLDNDGKLSTIIPNPPDGSAVFIWNVANQDLDYASTFAAGAWSSDIVINPGQGFFLWVDDVPSGTTFVNTFPGIPRVGLYNNSLVGNMSFEAIGSLEATNDLVSNILGCYPASDGDMVFRWNDASQDIDPTIPTYVASMGQWVPDVMIGVAEGFFIVRADGSVTWPCVH